MQYGEAAATGVGVTYAGFWPRFVALLIDGIILGIIGGVISAIFGESPGEAGAGTGVGLIINIVYFTVTLSQWGQTLGGKALGIKVVDANGQMPSVGAAVIRSLMAYVSAAVILIGYLWMLWDPRKQTWHDKVAGTFVVKA
jgi:uncharacterized RDD family membrane protein YckC